MRCVPRADRGPGRLAQMLRSAGADQLSLAPCWRSLRDPRLTRHQLPAFSLASSPQPACPARSAATQNQKQRAPMPSRRAGESGRSANEAAASEHGGMRSSPLAVTLLSNGTDGSTENGRAGEPLAGSLRVRLPQMRLVAISIELGSRRNQRRVETSSGQGPTDRRSRCRTNSRTNSRTNNRKRTHNRTNNQTHNRSPRQHVRWDLVQAMQRRLNRYRSTRPGKANLLHQSTVNKRQPLASLTTSLLSARNLKELSLERCRPTRSTRQFAPRPGVCASARIATRLDAKARSLTALKGNAQTSGLRRIACETISSVRQSHLAVVHPTGGGPQACRHKMVAKVSPGIHAHAFMCPAGAGGSDVDSRQVRKLSPVHGMSPTADSSRNAEACFRREV